MEFLAFASRLDSLIQRLQHTRIHRGNDVDGRVELFFGHPCFPCVRKAALHSRIAKPHHRHSQSDQHLLPFGETGHGVRVSVELAKVRFIQCRTLSVSISEFRACWPKHMICKLLKRISEARRAFLVIVSVKRDRETPTKTNTITRPRTRPFIPA
jgi:hypothetical protein